MNPYVMLGGGVAAIALLAGAYAYGRGDGKAIEVGKQAAVEAAVAKERKLREDKLDQVGAVAEQHETVRQANVREIFHETSTITERPVYRNICVDADGVRALDRAADVANGADPGGVFAVPAGASPSAPLP